MHKPISEHAIAQSVEVRNGYLLESFLRMVRHSRRALPELDANAAVNIEARLLELASGDHGTFPYLP